MAKYKVALNHDIALLSLVDLFPQPRGGEVLCERAFTDTGIFENPKYCFFKWNLLGTAISYQSILEQFGLLVNLTSNVTIYTRDDVYIWKRYNGVAVRPEFGEDAEWTKYFPREIQIYVNRLELLA